MTSPPMPMVPNASITSSVIPGCPMLQYKDDIVVEYTPDRAVEATIFLYDLF